MQVAAREAVRAAVEEALGLQLGLLVEFTGLICWRPGSRIGWHHDANRPYLRQRTHSAVCYLQTAGVEFGGGTFQFEQGADGTDRPQDVLASPGRVVAYDAHEVHGVTPVEWGERCALTLWFTDVPEHCEDSRLLAQLAGAPPRPLGLPSSMWLLEDGTDLRLCRLAMAGLALVHNGCLLHNAEAVPEGEGQQRLQLAVQPAVLSGWLAWKHSTAAPGAAAADPAAAAAAAASTAAGAMAAGGCSGALQDAVQLVPGIEFSGVQQAVLALQRWAWRRCPGSWARERVCSTHLHGLLDGRQQQQQAATQACTCAWLRTCRLSSKNGLNELIREEELAEAATAEAHAQAAHQAALDELLPRWLQLGALFIADYSPTMEARPSGHKRNFSAYDSQQLEPGFDPSGKAARPVEEQAAEGEAEPQEEQQHEEAALTESAAFSLTALRQAQESVIRQIDELQEAGLHFLDHMRAAFLERIAQTKLELGQALDSVEVSLRSNSAQTLDCRKRAALAGELVERLGIRTQDTAAPDLFSAEQEGAAAELPEAE
ncbi:hypothetical protein COHA_007191 [Chlorella ohadii]|uniref:Fe2OG dioxygenase domain-containing protein n=1 Tax=Chlorella ohadii TaxID=2649997 RepID=A0AAD5DMF1_9CHLO|nr:hypothetical protein COHA_007191 [Chlorella ohadii]